MQKIKNFFMTLAYYICLPFLWLSARKDDKRITRIVAEGGGDLLTEKDIEFLKSIGVETDLKTLRKKCKK